MKTLDEIGMTVTNLFCPKCQRHIGRNIDDVYLCIGDARFYESVRFTCRCGKPHQFRVKDFDIAGFAGETKKILNNLGNRKKFIKQKERKRE